MGVKLAGISLAITVCLGPSQTGTRQVEFEVASIKPAKADIENDRHPINCSSAGRFVASNVPASYLIGWAYLIKTDFSVPTWASIDGDRYDVEAKAAGPISLAECRVLVQHLLEDRFQVKVHTEDRETKVYFLTVTKHGSKLRELRTDTPATESDGIFIQGQKIGARAWETWKLAAWLGSVPSLGIGVPVLDRTELKGLYQFKLDFGTGDSPDIFQALQEQLGLKLESGKAPVEFTVVDRVARPTAN